MYGHKICSRHSANRKNSHCYGAKAGDGWQPEKKFKRFNRKGKTVSEKLTKTCNACRIADEHNRLRRVKRAEYDEQDSMDWGKQPNILNHLARLRLDLLAEIKRAGD